VQGMGTRMENPAHGRLGPVNTRSAAVDGYAIRRLQLSDSVSGQRVVRLAFSDLAARQGVAWPEPDAEERARRGAARIQHIIDTDPDGAWGAFQGDEIVGLALAIRRGDLWGLSLLVVDPAHQSTGIGRRLLGQTLDYGDGCRGGLILSSSDPRALRAYATAGFDLHPTANALGIPDRRRIPEGLGVEDDLEADLELVDDVDRRIRGASHRPDIPTLIEAGGRFLRAVDGEGRGYAVIDHGPVLLAATNPAVARRLLWTALALSSDDATTMVTHIDARQQWAFDVVLEARLELMPQLGALMVRGEVGELVPYLPSGAYL
jgi:GNAT superfamily N-acetyltransferase